VLTLVGGDLGDVMPPGRSRCQLIRLPAHQEEVLAGANQDGNQAPGQNLTEVTVTGSQGHPGGLPVRQHVEQRRSRSLLICCGWSVTVAWTPATAAASARRTLHADAELGGAGR
jgi:hypothetical protein